MSNNVNFSTLTKSHNSTEYQTPKDFFDKLNNIFHFQLDPCTTIDNSLKLPYTITKEKDGLICHKCYDKEKYRKKKVNKV